MSDNQPTNLYTALLAAMRACGPVRKNATNPHLKSKYADLGSVLDTIEQPLWDNGLLIVQRFTHDQGGAILVTELIHAASCEKMASHVPIVCKDPLDPQKIGAAITYYRRYSLLALLGLAPEDDDGHAAAQPAPPPANQPTRAPARLSAPPAPAPSRPVAAPTVAAGYSYTKTEYEAAIEVARKMQEAGDTYPAIVAYMRTHRDRLTPDQLEDSREEMRALKAKIFPDLAAVS